MTAQHTSPLAVGQIFEIGFESFTPRITIRSESELTVEILSGANAGFSDTVAYQAVTIRDGLIWLTWQEHNGSTIVHALDFTARQAHTAVTPFSGGFLRLKGPIEIRNP